MFCGAYVNDIATCGDDAIIGWGQGDSLVWLCLHHYEEALRVTRDVISATGTEIATEINRSGFPYKITHRGPSAKAGRFPLADVSEVPGVGSPLLDQAASPGPRSRR